MKSNRNRKTNIWNKIRAYRENLEKEQIKAQIEFLKFSKKRSEKKCLARDDQ